MIPKFLRNDPLWRAVALLDVSWRRVLWAITAGILCLGSAVALAACSAWLIARASQMPPVLYLQVAVVSVRAFGISRGVFRYLERLASHDIALRGVATLRERLYTRLANGRLSAIVSLRRGDLLARVGADTDAIGDVVVRGLLPYAVAFFLSLGSAVLVGVFLPAAGWVLAACLLISGVFAPWLSAKASRDGEKRAVTSRSAISTTTMSMLDSAAELSVNGQIAPVMKELEAQETELRHATDLSARPASWSAAINGLTLGVSVVAAIVLGIQATLAGHLDPVILAVVVLTPLASFEATSILPAAAVQIQRSRAAAARIMALLDDAAPDGVAEHVVDEPSIPLKDPVDASATIDPAAAAADDKPTAVVATTDLLRPEPTRLRAENLTVGWPSRGAVLTGVDLDLKPGKSIAIVGPSGNGKTTLLLSLAGLIPTMDGTVEINGRPVNELTTAESTSAVSFVAEDAHIFETTVLENLRVARGSTTEAEAVAALSAAGLKTWIEGLPQGVHTPLSSDATTISGGERRRLLLARAMLTTAGALLLDEPGEHLDPATSDRLVRDLLGTAQELGRPVILVTHRVSALDHADEILVIADTPGTGISTIEDRGSHAELMARRPEYRASWEHEQTIAAKPTSA